MDLGYTKPADGLVIAQRFRPLADPLQFPPCSQWSIVPIGSSVSLQDSIPTGQGPNDQMDAIMISPFVSRPKYEARNGKAERP